MAKIEEGNIESFRPQGMNSNKHSIRGMSTLEASMRKHGYVAPITVAASGEAIDGSARLETIANVFDEDVLIVHHSGDKPIIMVRDDIATADTPEARAISLSANRIAEMNLVYDAEVLLADLNAGIDMTGLFDKAEIDALLAGLQDPDWNDGFSGLPNEDRQPFQQMTFTLHDTQCEQVKQAMAIASRLGDFTDSPNQNSNGNALAFICETFITEHGQS